MTEEVTTVDALPDEELLRLCEAQLDERLQGELEELLDRRREGELTPRDGVRLEELMRLYRLGLTRKAQALKEAVARGLRPPLS